MPDRSSPRVALLGFSIECNKFAPPATKAHFLARTYLEGDAIVQEARSPTPTMLPESRALSRQWMHRAHGRRSESRWP